MQLSPLFYHLQVRDHFKQHPKTWDFFAAMAHKTEQLEKFKTELLKNTYQFFPDNDKRIFDAVDTAKQKLDLPELPVTVYQAQFTDELNAQVIYLNDHAHIVFSGPVLKLLDDAELLAVIAHELSHIKLFALENGELETADRIITSIANDLQSEMAYSQTARLFKLYTEIFCDRGAYLVCGSVQPIISSLVKMATGLEQVNAESYLQQANEIFNRAEINTQGVSHPENFIRAKAVDLWATATDDAEKTIAKMIEGSPDLDSIDLFQQQKLTLLTQQLLGILLQPKWMQSNTNLGLARHYFDKFSLTENAISPVNLSEQITGLHATVKEYCSYILYDFATADSNLELVPLGFCSQLAEELALKANFEDVLKKEYKLTQKKMEQLVKKAVDSWQSLNDS
jgi:hypothetical protein